jgi:hypothetical protein
MHRSENPLPGRAGRPTLASGPGGWGWLRAALTASVVVGIGLAPGAGRADPGSPLRARTTAGAGPGANGAAEATRLRGELERLNREIDALKQRRRSLGEDYELRRKMADAEARARRLTELERRTGAREGGPTAASPSRADPGSSQAPGAAPFSLSPAPRLEPSDDREVLDAKADILADQARRLEGQAQLLERRVTSLRGRQELRRRARDLEQDPFSPLEQSKRRVPIGSALSTSPKALAPASGATVDNSSSSNTGFAGTNTGNRGTGSAIPGGGEGNMPTPTLAGAGPAANMPSGGAATNQAVPVSSPAPPGAPGGNAVATSSGPVTPVGGPGGGGTSDSAGSLALQFRDVLDPTTLMEIRRLEGTGATGASLPATEHALAALRARARQLQAEADAARQAAHPAARPPR